MKRIIIFGTIAMTTAFLTTPGLRAGEVDRTAIKVTASSYEQKAKGGWADNPPEQSLDSNLKTAWMAEGDGQWIQYDLGSSQQLKGVKIAWAGGDKRVYTFDILVSATGADGSWTTVGDHLKSGGKTADLEEFDFPTPQAAQFVRIVGHGNTKPGFTKWCNVAEIQFETP
jgi:hypothetical protein